MKKITLTGMAALFLCSALTTGCFGEFALTRKLYSWNKDVSSNKFVQTLIFWAFNIVPVYGVAGFIDSAILNLIEFWTGSNPIAMNEGQFERQIVKAKDGKTYEITATKNRFDIKDLSSKEVRSIVFKPEEGICSVIVKGIESKLVSVDPNTNAVTAYRLDGTSMTFNGNADVAMVKDMFMNTATLASAK